MIVCISGIKHSIFKLNLLCSWFELHSLISSPDPPCIHPVRFLQLGVHMEGTRLEMRLAYAGQLECLTLRIRPRTGSSYRANLVHVGNLCRTTLLSWSGDGGSHWSFSLGGLIPLPLVDYTGGIIAADGYSLVGYYTNGTPRGDPVRLYPTQGDIFDLSIAAGIDAVVLLYKCGFLAIYLTSKTPNHTQSCPPIPPHN